jgi:anaerobic ribonucleoside-triphosphate reductase-activating protein
LWQIVVSCVFSIGKNWADYSIVFTRISPKATYFSLLVQSKVGKRKHTPIKSLILILFNFLYRNFRTRFAQTSENFLKIENHSGDLDRDYKKTALKAVFKIEAN